MARNINESRKFDSVTEGGITLVEDLEGNFAIPGGFHVTNKGYARQIAKRLAFENQNVISPIKSLTEKHVTRIAGLSPETVVMSA